MKLQDRSNFLESNRMSSELDRTLASPDYGDQFIFLLRVASDLARAYLGSPMASREWRYKYRTGCRKPLKDLSEALDQFCSWLVEFSTKCPDAARRLLSQDLLQSLGAFKELRDSENTAR